MLPSPISPNIRRVACAKSAAWQVPQQEGGTATALPLGVPVYQQSTEAHTKKAGAAVLTQQEDGTATG